MVQRFLYFVFACHWQFFFLLRVAAAADILKAGKSPFSGSHHKTQILCHLSRRRYFYWHVNHALMASSLPWPLGLSAFRRCSFARRQARRSTRGQTAWVVTHTFRKRTPGIGRRVKMGRRTESWWKRWKHPAVAICEVAFWNFPDDCSSSAVTNRQRWELTPIIYPAPPIGRSVCWGGVCKNVGSLLWHAREFNVWIWIELQFNSVLFHSIHLMLNNIKNIYILVYIIFNTFQLNYMFSYIEANYIIHLSIFWSSRWPQGQLRW